MNDMSHGQQLEQSHQQTHMLSTKQIEGLEILTMGAVELNSFLTEEQLSNPILELESSMQPIDSASASSGQTDDEKAYYDIPDRHEMQLDEYLVSQLPQQELPKDKLLLLVKVIGLIDEKTGYFPIRSNGCVSSWNDQRKKSPGRLTIFAGWSLRE